MNKSATNRSACIWALCALLLVSAVLGYSGTNARLIGPPLGESIGQDVRAWVRAANDIRAGRSLYSRSIAYGRDPDIRKFLAWDAGASYYVYPPLLALVMAPFVPVSEDGIIRAWAGVSLLLLAATALLMVHLALGVSPLEVPAWSLMALIVSLTCYPAQNVLTTGNVDTLLLFLVVLTYFLYRRRTLLAAFTLALAIAIKPQLALLSAFFLWKRDWRLVIAAALATSALLILSFSAVGWEQLPAYMEVNRLYLAETAMRAYPLNQATSGLALRALTANGYIEPVALRPMLARVVPVVVALLATATWCFGTSRSENRSAPLSLVEFGLTLTTITLVLPYLGENQLVWLLVPLLALLLVSTATTRSGKVFPVLAVLLVIYLGLPDVHDAIWKGWESKMLGHGLVDRRYLLLTGAYLYGVVLLHAVTATYLVKSRALLASETASALPQDACVMTRPKILTH